MSAEGVESSVSIRRGTVADARPLAEFAARTFVETFGPQNNPEDLEAYLATAYGESQQAAELADPEVITLLAMTKEAIVGYAQVRKKHAPPCVTHDRPVEVYRFYVDRPAQGTGLAAALMAEARQVARELGGLHLWLGVWERNARGIAFYRKMGFTDIGSHDFYVGSDRQTDRVLITTLSS